MKKVIMISLFIFLSSGVYAQDNDIKLSKGLIKLAEINIQNGISKKDAHIIAEVYFTKHVGCGVFKDIQDCGMFWCVNAFFGYAGTPVKDFRIDKQWGQIFSPIGPSYKNLKEFTEKVMTSDEAIKGEKKRIKIQEQKGD